MQTTAYHDKFTFAASAGVEYTIAMASSAFDTWLVLKDPANAVVAQDDDGGGGTNSKIVFAPRAAGTYTVETTSYAAKATGAYTVSLAAGAGPAPTTGPAELVTNGGFESGVTGWTQSATAIVNNSTAAPAASGSYKATMLGKGVSGSAYLYQAPAFPTSGGDRTLRFKLRIRSDEDTSYAYDKLTVRVMDSSNTLLQTLATFSNVNKTTYANYQVVTLTIPASLAAAGNMLRFNATEDSMVATAFYVDDVSIQ